MNALSDLQLRVSHAVGEREQRELEKAAEVATENPQLIDYPDVINTPDEEKTPKPVEEDYSPVPSKSRWWEKLTDAIPFFKSPRTKRTSS